MKRSMGVFLPDGHNSETGLPLARRRMARWFRGIAAVVVVALVLAACGASTATGTMTPTIGALPTSTPAPTSSPSAGGAAAPPSVAVPSNEATGVPTALDPCQLVTSQEASQLAGASYGAGQESTTAGGGKMCVYGSGTLNVFEVLVGQAPDVATAKAGKAEAEAAILAQAGNGLKFTELPTFADGAAYIVGSITVGGQTYNGSAIYALKGTIFFGFSDLALGHATPTLPALEAQATVILGRLP
jgi:hypothetical protein